MAHWQTVRSLDRVDRNGLAAAARNHQARVAGSAPTAKTDTGMFVAALNTHLAAGAADDWTLTPWHRVETGTWNLELSELALVLTNRKRLRYRLPEPGLVPEVMRERVASTIIFERWFEMSHAGGGVTVSARRSLIDGQVEWTSSLGRGLDRRSPKVAKFAAAAVYRMQSQYGFD